jgi:hypothetical protein
LIYKACDNTILITSLTDGNTPIDDATITATLTDTNGLTIATASLDYSLGEYSAVFTAQDTAHLCIGKTYFVVISITVGSRIVDTRREQHIAAWRDYGLA